MEKVKEETERAEAVTSQPEGQEPASPLGRIPRESFPHEPEMGDNSAIAGRYQRVGCALSVLVPFSFDAALEDAYTL